MDYLGIQLQKAPTIEETSVVGLFVIIHPRTGLFHLGVSRDLSKHLFAVQQSFERGYYGNPRLREAYAEDKLVLFGVHRTDTLGHAIHLANKLLERNYSDPNCCTYRNKISRQKPLKVDKDVLPVAEKKKYIRIGIFASVLDEADLLEDEYSVLLSVCDKTIRYGELVPDKAHLFRKHLD